MFRFPLSNENRFRISITRRHSQHVQSRRVAFPIPPPVLLQYNYIDLQKNSNQKRINHVSACLKIPKGKQFRRQTSPNKWQQSLGQYMCNKEKIQTRKGSLHNQFQFLKLSKINRYRKKKLAEEHSIPIDNFSSTFFSNSYEHQPISQSCNMKNQIKLSNNLFSLGHIYHSSEEKEEPLRKNQGLQYSLSPESQQQRILSKFVTSYFKKKYKRSKQFLEVIDKKGPINLQSIVVAKVCGQTMAH